MRLLSALVVFSTCLMLAACGGASSSSSLPPPVISVSVSPSSAIVPVGQKQQFTPVVTGSSDTAVTWQVDGTAGGNSVDGTISNSGLYQAPLQPPSGVEVTVTAVSDAASTAMANAEVTVVPPPLPGSTDAGFFGMHMNQLSTPWPTTLGVPFSSWGSHDSGGTRWSEINQGGSGVYNWTLLDDWLARAAEYGQDALFTLYSTPNWAASNPALVCDGSAIFGNGTCTPPDDLNADGTGTDQHVKDFVTALMNHVGTGKIKYIEIWNEPNNLQEWTGTQAQIVRMTQDVRTVAQSIDPNVLICSPPETGDGTNSEQMNWLGAFLAAGGGAYIDVITFHGHVPDDTPELIATRIDNTRIVMGTYGQLAKPIFDTEGSWPGDGTPPVDEVAFTGRHLLLQIGEQIQKFYLYAFDLTSDGYLYDRTQQMLTPNATAYQQIYAWTVGALPSGPCSASGTVWSCDLTRANNYQALAVWDASGTCFNCTTATYEVPAQFTQYRDLAGNLTPISGSTVPIGPRPILLETGTP